MPKLDLTKIGITETKILAGYSTLRQIRVVVPDEAQRNGRVRAFKDGDLPEPGDFAQNDGKGPGPGDTTKFTPAKRRESNCLYVLLHAQFEYAILRRMNVALERAAPEPSAERKPKYFPEELKSYATETAGYEFAKAASACERSPEPPPAIEDLFAECAQLIAALQHAHTSNVAVGQLIRSVVSHDGTDDWPKIG